MSDIIRTKFTVLNEFRHSRSKRMPMGTDYSSNYAFDKNIMLYIYDPKLGSLITFKSFLQDFSINFNISYEEDDTEEGSGPVNPRDFTCNYKLKLDVPSPALNDAKINDGKFSELNRMIIGQTLVDDETQRFIDQPKRILMANLIHNGLYKEGSNITSRGSVIKYGIPCRFSNINWEPDLGVGFFESGGRIWPKSYSFDLDLDLSFKSDPQLPLGKNNIKRRSFSGFNPNGGYEATDIRTWPFGDVSNTSMEDYSNSYTKKKSAFVFFKFGFTFIKFKPFLDGFSFNLERTVITPEGQKIYSRTPRTGNFKKASYSLSFSVLAANIKEAKQNHNNFQILARMICPNENDLEKNRIMKVQFANLISKLGKKGKVSISHINNNGIDLIAKSVSYVPIMELGFFEQNNCIYAKGFKISLNLESPLIDEVLQPPIRRSGFNYGYHAAGRLVASTGRDDEARQIGLVEEETAERPPPGNTTGAGTSTSETDPRDVYRDTDGDGLIDTYYNSKGEPEEIPQESQFLADPEAELPEDADADDVGEFE